MDDAIDMAAQACKRGQPVALASLVESSGSIPMSTRAKMAIFADGTTAGTIGGGCLEAEIIAVGRQVMATGSAHTTRYTMTEKQAGESGLNCGGTVRIYTEPVIGADGAVIVELARARRERAACALVSVLSDGAPPGPRALYLQGGRACPAFGDPLLDRQARAVAEGALESERAVLFAAPAAGVPEVFAEPFLPAPVLYVFGGGHVGAQIGHLASGVGFRVVVVDDRPLFASPERHPEVDECVAIPMEGAFERLAVDERTYIVAATRGHQHDEIVVEQAIRTPARYIGMLGSERKKLLLWERIAARGGSRERLAQVYAPLGLNIGADTPEEIAVSVVAELIEVRRGARHPWSTKAAAGPLARSG
ncbi:MAG: XdhC family protein [Gemmatimonadota bacterium]